MQAFYNVDEKGEHQRYEEIPAEYKEQAEEYRAKLLDVCVFLFDDDLTTKILEEARSYWRRN